MENSSVFRKMIYDLTSDQQSKVKFFLNVKKSLTMNDNYNVVYRYATIPILYLDSYKKLSSRLKSGSASPEEMQMFSVYKDIETVDDLIVLYKKRDDYILYSIESVRDFYELPVLGKINLIKQLSQYENMELSSFSKHHDEDLNKFDIDVDEDLLYKFYKRYSNKLNELNYCFSDLSIFTMIAGFIQNSYVYDPVNTYNLICRLNESIFTNIDKFKQEVEANDSYVDELKNTFYKDSQSFNDYCLYENGTLIDIVTIYISMREANILKGKVYKNTKNE